MYIYLICPVRNQTAEQGIDIEEWVATQEKYGTTVFYPKRDAPQDSETGFELVESELKAIQECDEVHVFWDVNSKGSHFDLGMAYALNKIIRFNHLFEEDGPEKSYVKVIDEKMKTYQKCARCSTLFKYEDMHIVGDRRVTPCCQNSDWWNHAIIPEVKD